MLQTSVETADSRAATETSQLPALRTIERPDARHVGPWSRRLLVATLLIPLVVSAVVLVSVVSDDYMPISDHALLELKTRDVGRHPVLTGLYSRDGWSHPGPAQFYVLALPHRLVGERSIGLPLGALAVNGLAIAGMVTIARRRGGTSLMVLTAVGSALLLRSLGPDFLRDPWNPYLPVLPFGLLIFLVWEMTCRSAWALPVGAAVASFCAQVHVGYVPIAIPLFLFGAAWLGTGTWRRRSIRPSRRRHRQLWYALALTLGIVAVMWLPPIVEELQHSPGNLSKTVDWFRAASEGTHSFGDGLRIVADQFDASADWLTGHIQVGGFRGEPASLFSNPVPVILLPFVLGAVAFWRMRDSEALRLVAILGLALALGVVSVSRTVGAVYEYRLRWLWVVAMLAVVAAAWAGWMLLTRSRRVVANRSLMATSIAAILVLTAMSSVEAAGSGTPHADMARPRIDGLARQLRRNLPEGNGDVVFDRTTSPACEYYAQGLLVALERDGVPVRVSEDVAARFGAHRVHRAGAHVRARLVVADAGALIDELQDPNARLVAYAGVSPAALQDSLNRLADLDRAYRTGRLSFGELLRRRATVPTRAIGVFLAA